jgi:DNA-directed RNA polymerase subunit RPC12/RpoP
MTILTQDHICVDCGRKGEPDHGPSMTEKYGDGFYVSCPDCGFDISGRSKTAVLTAVAVLAQHYQQRLDDLMKGAAA